MNPLTSQSSILGDGTKQAAGGPPSSMSRIGSTSQAVNAMNAYISKNSTHADLLTVVDACVGCGVYDGGHVQLYTQPSDLAVDTDMPKLRRLSSALSPTQLRSVLAEWITPLRTTRPTKQDGRVNSGRTLGDISLALDGLTIEDATRLYGLLTHGTYIVSCWLRSSCR